MAVAPWDVQKSSVGMDDESVLIKVYAKEEGSRGSRIASQDQR
jgi:hypothetical protein